MHRRGHQHALCRLVRAHRHQHRFSKRRRAVVETRVGHVHRGQRRHHRLVFVQELQRALARFGLIGRIGRIEFAARRDLPHRRRDMVFIRAAADEIQPAAVALGALLHEPRDFHFADARRHPGQRGVAQCRGDLVEEIVDRRHANRGKHGTDVVSGVRYERHEFSAGRRPRSPGMQPRRAGPPVRPRPPA